MSKATSLLESANRIAQTVETWADLSNALFDPETGLISRAFPTRKERAEFLKSPEYRKIRELIDAAVQRSGLVEGATPRKSGKFVVRLPKSLHAALDHEAKLEGVSLNQLVVAKLAAQMSEIVAARTR
jgi:predicted HicB family RNase H-like nuclease